MMPRENRFVTTAFDPVFQPEGCEIAPVEPIADIAGIGVCVVPDAPTPIFDCSAPAILLLGETGDDGPCPEIEFQGQVSFRSDGSSAPALDVVIDKNLTDCTHRIQVTLSLFDGGIGPAGPQGPRTSIVGPQGFRGFAGEMGPMGETGAAGETGAVGLDGGTGPTGPTGPCSLAPGPGQENDLICVRPRPLNRSAGSTQLASHGDLSWREVTGAFRAVCDIDDEEDVWTLDAMFWYRGIVLPTNAEITGIEVWFRRTGTPESAFSPVGSVVDHGVRVFAGGRYRGETKTRAGNWPLDGERVVYGGHEDSWETTFYPSYFLTRFGFGVWARFPAGSPGFRAECSRPGIVICYRLRDCELRLLLEDEDESSQQTGPQGDDTISPDLSELDCCWFRWCETAEVWKPVAGASDSIECAEPDWVGVVDGERVLICPQTV